MKNGSSADVLRRVKEIVERHTRQILTGAAEAELNDMVRGAFASESSFGSLPPQARQVTILLADLRGFSTLATSEPAESLISLLNHCLARLSDVIYQHRGTIDKFMGDAIMVLFGAPVQRPDDVARSLACAIQMQIAMAELNTEHAQQGLPLLHLGIGVHTGVVMAGRFGGTAYSEYTVIGDEVNLASRIEAFSLRGQVLISETTYRHCADQVVVTPPMEVHVKGKPQLVRLRELIAFPSLGLKVPRQEMRRSHRVEVQMPCVMQLTQNKIVLPNAIAASVRDIGYHGLQLSLDQPLEMHAELRLEFDLMLVNYHVADLYAKVVNVSASAGMWLVGVEFTSISAEADEKVQTFVQLLVAGA
ncbi:MAG: adenylate/guanylate cyclase domain-containing protein [Burkholderiaceae bacterium]